MKIKQGWEELQKTFENTAFSEVDFYYDVKKDDFFYSVDKQIINKEHVIYLGIWSDKAQFEYFEKYIQALKETFLLYDLCDIPKEIRKKHCNGCGSGWNAKIVPEFSFHNCCEKHDFRYLICNDKSDERRSWIDKMFLWDMKRNSNTFIEKLLAYKYYFMVRLFGKKAFINSKI